MTSSALEPHRTCWFSDPSAVSHPEPQLAGEGFTAIRTVGAGWRTDLTLS